MKNDDFLMPQQEVMFFTRYYPDLIANSISVSIYGRIILDETRRDAFIQEVKSAKENEQNPLGEKNPPHAP